MADVGQLATALALGMKQQGAPPLMAGQGAPSFLDMLKYPDATPGGAIREINPGVTWGGKDRNNMNDLDVQMYRTYGIPLQRENI